MGYLEGERDRKNERAQEYAGWNADKLYLEGMKKLRESELALMDASYSRANVLAKQAQAIFLAVRCKSDDASLGKK